MALKFGIGKKDQPVDTRLDQMEEEPDGQLSGRFPYLEKKAKETTDELRKAQEQLLDIQTHVRNIRRQQELYEFIINNQKVTISAAWLLERIQQIKDPTMEYSAERLEDDIIQAIQEEK